MSEWKESELEEVIECLIDYRGKTPKKTKIGVPLITAKIIKGGAISTPDEFIADSDYDSWMVRGYPQKGDVVLTTEAPLGEVAQLDNKKIALAQRVVCLRGKKDILDNTYLKYYFISKRGHTALTSKGTGTTVIGIKQSELRKVNVVYPPLPTQRRIAAILSSLDAKIENNNKVNAKLEEIAQNLFKEWFVDFGPFKNGKFVDSELGPIPEGWRVGSVYEYVNVVYGAPYKSDKFNENGLGLPLIRIRDLKTNKPQVSTEEILPQTEYVEAGDIVAGMDAEFIPFIWKGEKGLLNQRVCKLKPQVVGIDDLFVMYLMLPHLIFTQSYKVGTTVSHIGKSDFDKFVSVLPPLDIVLHFSEKIAPMRSEIVRLSKETRELATLRDTLLPKLMSGEIKV